MLVSSFISPAYSADITSLSTRYGMRANLN
jgi:hypothetical protein